MGESSVLHEIPNFYRIIPLQQLRRTPGVAFDTVPMDFLPRIDAIDRVLHARSAISPGPVGSVSRPWYMHTAQEDNLIVLFGTRDVDIYTREHGLQRFTVTPERILRDGALFFDGPAMLVWSRLVFHRITSGPEGSASLNFAVHTQELDMRTNFNIYDLDTETGEHRVIREGFRDQAR